MRIDLNSLIPGSQYFRWREFFRSATADARGIDNRPNSNQVYFRIIYLTDRVLEPLREALGPIKINSGYRCPQLNKAVGGSAKSFHAFGSAVDIVPFAGNSHTVRDIFTYIHSRLPYTELIAEDIPNGWVHVALERGRENERQLKYKLVGGKVQKGGYHQIMELFK